MLDKQCHILGYEKDYDETEFYAGEYYNDIFHG